MRAHLQNTIPEFLGEYAIVARRGGVSAILVGARFEDAWRVPSWDGFYIPKPFSRVWMRAVLVTAAELGDRDDAAGRLEARLNALNPDGDPSGPPPVL